MQGEGQVGKASPLTPQLNSVQQFEPLLDVEQAARLLGGIHVKTLQKMAREGEVPAFRLGRYWFFRASALNQWLQLQSTGRIARVM